MGPLRDVTAAWWAWMLPMFVQSSLLILVVGTVDLLIRRWAWPQVRYALWVLVLVKLVLPPAWSLPTGVAPRLEQQLASRVDLPWRAPPPPAPAEPTAATSQRLSLPGDPAGVAEAPAASLDGRPAVARAFGAGSPLVAWAFVVWTLGVLAFVLLLAMRLTMMRRWHDLERRGQTIPPWYHDLLLRAAGRLGIGRLPAIVFSDRLLAPAVCGLMRPVLYLPRDYTESLSSEEAEHVLLHELAHLKRGDLWLNALGLMVQVLYWFNPLVALALRQTRHVREICTDLTVADVLRETTEAYRLTLLRTARRLLTESAAPGLGLLGVFEEPFHLVSRLRWLDKWNWRRRKAASAVAVAMAAFMLVFVLPMAGRQPPSAGPLRGREGPLPGRTLYVRNETRREEDLLGVRVRSVPVGWGETWVSERVLITREGGRTIVLNRVDNTLTWIDHADRSYVIVPLPLDLEEAAAHEVRSYVGTHQTSGQVSSTGRTRRILGQRCSEYRVESWPVGRPPAADSPVVRVWASNDLPVRLDAFREFLNCVRLLSGYDMGYRRELLKIDGLQMRLVREEHRPLGVTRLVDEAVRMEWREPPPDVLVPPAGYERRTRISQL